MSLLTSKKKESVRKPTAKKKPEVRDLKDAYILPQEQGDQFIQTLAELPIKYGQMIGPILDMLQKSVRGNITVIIDPNKPAPPSALGPEAGKAPGEIPPKPKATPKSKEKEGE